MTSARAPENCANCGAEIPPTAHACPECGADERTGWGEQSVYDGVDLPEETFASGEPDDPGARRRWSQSGRLRFWRFVALGLLVVLAGMALRHGFRFGP